MLSMAIGLQCRLYFYQDRPFEDRVNVIFFCLAAYRRKITAVAYRLPKSIFIHLQCAGISFFYASMQPKIAKNATVSNMIYG